MKGRWILKFGTRLSGDLKGDSGGISGEKTARVMTGDLIFHPFFWALIKDMASGTK